MWATFSLCTATVKHVLLCSNCSSKTKGRWNSALLQTVLHRSESTMHHFMRFSQLKVKKELKKQSKKNNKWVHEQEKTVCQYCVYVSDFSNTEKLHCLTTVFLQMYYNGKVDGSSLRKQLSPNTLNSCFFPKVFL